MPKILIIADHRLNRSPSQRYRFEQYLNYFKVNGFDWELSEIISQKDDKVFYSPGNYFKKAWILFKSLFIRLNDLRRAKQFDVIFIQRFYNRLKSHTNTSIPTHGISGAFKRV